ncbi:hypothetical protein BDZ91DRAFT_781850 [Kalaharituber pfeilii]|nr:hypothetical protein BDZ91DRAFT_781850 [Kalaharituber pfeilii]
MNNAQFRKLVLDTPRVERGDGSPSSKGVTPAPAALPALGSKKKAFVPMTPRSVFTHTDFARQLAAQNAPPQKKFKSSAAPKGTKLGEGYIDRAKAREAAEIDAEIAERERRLEALKELARNPETGEIDMELLIQQSKAMGGDVKSTHLVKGLDFALLERVKKGEDVMGLRISSGKNDSETDIHGRDEEKLEEELDKALDKTIVPKEKEKVKKSGHKVTREELLAELKRQKQEAAEKKAAAAPPVPSLGSKFRKIGQQEPKKGDKEGKNKKKKKKAEESAGGRVKEKSKTPLGMLPPALPNAKPTPKPVEEDDDINIFDDAGTDYDPLAGLAEDDGSETDSSSSDDEKGSVKQKLPATTKETPEQDKTATEDNASASSAMASLLHPKPNYFNEKEEEKEEERYQPPTSASALLAQNPELAAALAKAAKLAPLSESSLSTEELEKQKKRKTMLEGFDRDAMDLDMGFGGTRNWEEDDEEFVEGSKSKKRKRGGKKKGDKNDAALVSKFAEEKYGKG